MAATKLNINISSVSICGTALTKITGLQVRQGAVFTKFKGDSDIYTTVAVNTDNDPGFTVTTGDVGGAEALKGTTGTSTATLNDAKAGSGGAVVWSLSNSYVDDVASSAQHAQFASSTVKVSAVSSDGTTNPMSVSRV